MRASIALFAVGEVATLSGIAMWSPALAAVLFGLQCIGLGLLRESQQQAARPQARGAHRPAPRRRWSWRRPKLRLLRGGVAS